ncbi:Pirin-like protein CC_3178 [uncultured Pleomorphomonas sp.]|uniref:Pirin-like protein CC_3178 n=1 Tax=uncultured Pleomorphomonas sp. TaxID=442121 RepID=A0A212KZ66_9HYPH|nr:pirin family protein [uncultured Pleomorphomonas sp.]SCM70604.1 Pirin-like protein CC_3178 [uncultured Pleomorphomonas sp.]
MSIPGKGSNDRIEEIVLPNVRDLGGFKVRRALPSAQRRMVGPFIFFDQMGPVMFGAGEAEDVRPHPHIGLSTLTYLFDGEMIHRDSAGHKETIRAGEVNWMTAGNGIVHSERFPAAVHTAGGNLFGTQIWVALPKASEEIAPLFSHHDKAILPTLSDAGVRMTLVAGDGFGVRSPVPVYSDLMYADVHLETGARFKVPPDHVERAAYVISGGIGIEGQDGVFPPSQLVIFRPGAEVILTAREPTRLVLIGGEPFPEKRHIYWNFVSSSRERIEAAKADWRARRFPEIVGETEFIPLPPDPPGLRMKE